MTPLFFALLGGYFILALAIRSLLAKRLCAMCAAVTLTWTSLLALKLAGYDTDARAIAVLMGGSAVGAVYYLSSRATERYEILKFPLLITLFWAAYVVLTGELPKLPILAIVAGFWFAFGSLFAVYENSLFRSLARKIVECCKNW